MSAPYKPSPYHGSDGEWRGWIMQEAMTTPFAIPLAFVPAASDAPSSDYPADTMRGPTWRHEAILAAVPVPPEAEMGGVYTLTTVEGDDGLVTRLALGVDDATLLLVIPPTTAGFDDVEVCISYGGDQKRIRLDPGQLQRWLRRASAEIAEQFGCSAD